MVLEDVRAISKDHSVEVKKISVRLTNKSISAKKIIQTWRVCSIFHSNDKGQTLPYMQTRYFVALWKC